MPDRGPVVQITGPTIYAGMDVASAKALGAVGDGSTDDTNALQAALNSLTSGGILFLAKGSYLVSSSLVPRDNTHIMGEGAACTEIRTVPGTTINAAATHGLIQVTDIEGLKVSGITFNGNGSWTGSAFSNPYGGGNSVGFTNDDWGIRINASSGNENIEIFDCAFTGLARGVYVQGVNDEEGVSIRNCRCTNLGFTGIYLENVDNFHISGNTVSGVHGNITSAGTTDTAYSKFGDGILITSSRNGTISDNLVSDFIRCGIIVEPQATTALSATTHTNTTLDGLSTTANLRVGMLVTKSDLALDTYIQSIDSGTAVTLTKVATGSSTSSATFLQCSQGVGISNNSVWNQKSGKSDQVWCGIYIGDGTTKNPITVHGNNVWNMFGSGTDLTGAGGVGILTQHSNVSAGAIFNCTDSGVIWSGGNLLLQGTQIRDCRTYGVRWTGSLNSLGDLRIHDCDIANNGFAGIKSSTVNQANTVIIKGCTIQDNGLLTTPLTSGNEGIGLCGIDYVAGYANQCVIRDNTFISSASEGATVGQLYGIKAQVSSNFNMHIRNNAFVFRGTVSTYPDSLRVAPCCFATYFTSGGYTVYDLSENGNWSSKQPWTNGGNSIAEANSGYSRCLGWASAAPTTGKYRAGDYFKNNVIATGQPFLFMCVASGTPGTWQSWGGV